MRKKEKKNQALTQQMDLWQLQHNGSDDSVLPSISIEELPVNPMIHVITF